jgi:hypothetical protein
VSTPAPRVDYALRADTHGEPVERYVQTAGGYEVNVSRVVFPWLVRSSLSAVSAPDLQRLGGAAPLCVRHDGCTIVIGQMGARP